MLGLESQEIAILRRNVYCIRGQQSATGGYQWQFVPQGLRSAHCVNLLLLAAFSGSGVAKAP